MKKGKIIKFISKIVIANILITSVFSITQNSSSIKALATDESKNTAALSRSNTYDAYELKYAEYTRPDETIVLPADSFTGSDMAVQIMDNFEGMDGKSIKTQEEGYIEWEINVTTGGLYNIGIQYYPVEGKSSAIERELWIDGKIPFMEARTLSFHRVWADADSIRQDSRGNDIQPSQIEVPIWQEAVFKDYMGYYNEPYKFYFSEGKHTIRLVSLKEPMMIRTLKLFQEKEAKSYKEIANEYKANGYNSVSGLLEKVQGEKTLYKSDPTLYPIFDRSSPATEPYHHSKLKLNTIGGDKWKLPGQWIVWEFSVPETGLYKIALRARQNVLMGLYTNRKLSIDGKIPFKEAEKISFNYSDTWQMNEIGQDGEPYLFYLEKGKHQLKLETTLGDMAEILRIIEDSVYRLNDAYRKILMITGPTPDTYRDYQLDIQLPDVMKTFEEQSEVLRQVSSKLVGYTGQKGSHAALLDRISIQLKEMADNPDTIPKRFDKFKGNVGALGTWILTTREQPLEIDYLLIASPEKELPKADKGFFAKVVHEVRMFLASFTEDFSTVGEIHDRKSAVTVWIGAGATGGRDQAQILKQMIDNRFTPETGINVNLELISMGALLPATLAGKGPDVALQIGGGEPVNYAFRNAVVDLSKFADFPEVIKRFHESAVVPFQYRDGVYALPETQSFPMLFYRKDILEELGLEVSKTWDDIYKLLPEIQKKHMEFALTPAMSSYGIFLYQAGGDFYKNDGIASNLDSETAIQSFKKWTELYANYKLPLQFDFANRFRIGEIPIGIADYTTYNLLSVFAPEINGLWDFAPVPGTMKPDGTIDRSAPGTAAGCIMMSGVKDKETAWEFMKWWTSAETQVQFGRELESIMGAAARYSTANLEALYQIPWHVRDFKNLNEQWKYVRGIPEVPGGYFTPRHLDFAFRNVVYNGTDARETLLDYIRIINEEIKTKRKEFGLNLE